MTIRTSREGAALIRQRWDKEAGLAQRKEARERKIRELIKAFPVTDAEAEAIRALLPPVRNEAK